MAQKLPQPLLQGVDPQLLFSKSDPLDMRLGDIVKIPRSPQSRPDLLATLEEISGEITRGIAITGYPDDEGIAKNGGRVGAKGAPTRIRNFFYRMTPPAFLPHTSSCEGSAKIYDFGDLDAASSDLGERHRIARLIATEFHRSGMSVLSFGGGHDYGFPDAAAYCETATARGERPLVINFDAHLDVRPMTHGITSGTPFFRLLEEFPEIDFVELGLQSQCNSKSHVDWLIERGGLISFEEERRAAGLSLTETLQRLLGDRALARRSAFLSVDIDAFSSCVAPGASQSWPTGFDPHDFFTCFSWCLGRFDVRGTGIYEVSPALDVDDRTSRLAALIAHRFVFQL